MPPDTQQRQSPQEPLMAPGWGDSDAQSEVKGATEREIVDI
ncbi:MAG: hypothetical protein ACR65U_13905 [Methylocystis sp.]